MEPVEGSFPRSPRRVKKWLTELQGSDIGELTRQFYHGLKHSNRLCNEPRLRIELLELMRPTGWLILDNLLARYASLSLPLPDKSRRIFDLHMAILQELAFGYKIALVDAAKGGDEVPARLLLLATERAISNLSEIMLRCAQLYQSLPKSIWSDLHQLYAGMEKLDLQGKVLRDAGPRGTAKLSVGGAYKRVLVFTLCSPNHLRRGESVLLFNKLEKWVDEVELGSSAPDAQSRRHGASFGVCLGTNAPPSRLGFVNAPDPAELRAIDLRRLLPLVDAELTRAPQQESPILDDEHLQRSTLLCIKASLSLASERKSGRAVRNNKALVETGLKDIHARLCHERKPAAPSGKDPALELSDLQLMSLPHAGCSEAGDGFITHPAFGNNSRDSQVWESVARGKPMNRALVNGQRDRVQARLSVKELPRQQNWNVVNVSAAGFGLRWQGDGPSRAHVGEVVALREKTRDGRTLSWRIGVIRWIQFTDTRSFLCGVQLLSPRVVPVVAERRHGVRAQDISSNECLMLPEIKAIKQSSTLLAPSHTFRQGDITTIRVGTKDVRVKLIEALEQTSFFTQFQIRLATGVTKVAATGSGTSLPAPREEGDEFSGLWRSL